MEAGAITVRLNLDASGMQGGISSLNQGITGVAAQFDVLQYAASAVFGYVEQGFSDTVGTAIAYSDQMQHVSDVTGMSAESAQKWNAANISVGGSLDSMLSSLQMVQGKIADTTTAGNTYRKTLDDLGIAYKDVNGNYLDADTLQKNILESLSKVTDATQRDSDARLIYGRGWASNAELITNATKALQTYNATPAPFSDDQIAAAHNMGIELDEFNAKLSITQTTLGMELLPSVNTLVTTFSSAFNEDSPVITFFSWLDGAIEDSVEGFAKLVGGIEAGTIAVADITSGKGLAQATADFQAQENKTTAYITNLHGQFDLSKEAMAQTSSPAEAASTPAATTPSDTTPAKAAKSTKTTTPKTGSGWDDAAIGPPGSEMNQFMMQAEAAGQSYSDALDLWAGEGQGTPANIAFLQQFQAGQANQGMNERAAADSGSTSTTTPASTTKTADAPSQYDTQLKAAQKFYSDLQALETTQLTALNKIEQTYWTNVTQMAQAALADWQSIATQISSIIAYENTITAKNGVAQSQPLAAQTVTGSSISTANPNTSITAGSPGGNTAPSAPAITVNVTAPSTDAGDIVNAARNALQVAGNSVSAGSLY